jgi:hypothetical protein
MYMWFKSLEKAEVGACGQGRLQSLATDDAPVV